MPGSGSAAKSAIASIASRIWLSTMAVDQVLLGREAAKQRRLADPGALGDLRGGGLQPALGEHLHRGGDDPLAVSLRVGAQLGGRGLSSPRRCPGVYAPATGRLRRERATARSPRRRSAPVALDPRDVAATQQRCRDDRAGCDQARRDDERELEAVDQGARSAGRRSARRRTRPGRSPCGRWPRSTAPRGPARPRSAARC